MNNIIVLTKVLLKTSNNMNVNNKKKGFIKNKKLGNVSGVLKYIFILILMSPIAFLFWDMGKKFYFALKPINQTQYLLAINFSMVSIVTFIFGIIYSFNTYYYSDDIENLLCLPFKSSEILISKFLTILIYEYMSLLIFYIPIMAVYGLYENVGIMYIIYSIIIYIFVPIAPLVLSGILAMFIMSFSGITKNKDRYKIISGIFGIAMGLGFNFLVQKMQKNMMNPEQLQKIIAEGNNSLLSKTNNLFPINLFAIKSLGNYGNVQGILNLIIYITFSLLIVVVFMIIGEKIYFKGAIGSKEGVSKRKKLSLLEMEKGTKVNSVLKACVYRELKGLFRSPTFFISCVLMNFIWPIFFMLPILVNGGAKEIFQFIKGAFDVNSPFITIIITAFISLGFLVCMMGPISTTAISREGKNIIFLKYAPISYKIQLIAKILSGIIINLLGIIIGFIIIISIGRPQVGVILICFIMSLLSCILGNIIGIFIDLIKPRLLWEDEQKAVKQNFMVFLYHIVMLLLSVPWIIISLRFKLNLYSILAIFGVSLIILNIVMFIIVLNYGVKKFNKIDI